MEFRTTFPTKTNPPESLGWVERLWDHLLVRLASQTVRWSPEKALLFCIFCRQEFRLLRPDQVAFEARRRRKLCLDTLKSVPAPREPLFHLEKWCRTPPTVSTRQRTSPAKPLMRMSSFVAHKGTMLGARCLKAEFTQQPTFMLDIRYKSLRSHQWF